MKTVEFFKLQRAIQDRFVGSVVSGFPPAALLSRHAGAPQKMVWMALAALSFVGLVIVTRLGYGSLESSLALHSWKVLGLYAALVFGLAFGLLQRIADGVRSRALPYKPGVYLFPANVIDARSDRFRVIGTEDLTGVDVQTGTVHLSFAGGRKFAFPCADAARLAGIVGEVQAARERAMHALAGEDARELVAVDPLHSPRFSSPVGPRNPYERKWPVWRHYGWAVAIGVAFTLAPTLWALRNAGSDKTLYAHATKVNDVASYRAYLARGKKFAQDVNGWLLPRAELREAIQTGRVAALLEFKATHPSSKVSSELTAAIRAAMLAELEKAKAAGTLAALENFARQYPEHGVAPELRASIHALYMRTLEAYKARSPVPAKDKNALALVERLFAFAEQAGPTVEIRFRRKKSESLGRADQHVAKTAAFMGEVSYPSKYFDEKHEEPRVTVLGKWLSSHLEAGLGPELFNVAVGAPLAPDGDALPAVTVPTLFVTHAAEWSGHGYSASKPRGSYVGIVFSFEALFVLPGGVVPVKVRTDLVKQAALAVLKEESLVPGAAETKVYDAMATDAFDTFARRWLSVFVAKSAQEN
jgi:hypothetical protein